MATQTEDTDTKFRKTTTSKNWSPASRKSVKTILNTAQNSIIDRANWSKGMPSKAGNNVWVPPTDPRAKRFTISGALTHAAALHGKKLPLNAKRALKLAYAHMTRILPIGVYGLIEFNNSGYTRHGDVVGAFTHAIKQL